MSVRSDELSYKRSSGLPNLRPALRVMSTVSVACLIASPSLSQASGGKPSVSSQRLQTELIKPIEAAKVENPEKVQLGKMLFFEPRLSRSGLISCNSCHNLMTSGADNVPTSIGHGWHKGPVNAPTVYNARFHLAQFWDGRAKDLAEQAKGPIEAPGEMGSTHGLAVETLNSIPEYKQRFQTVYKTSTIQITQVADAIAAFEETLVTPGSRFDAWLMGDDKALTEQELRGYESFKSVGCVSCHMGPAVGGESYQKLGVVKAYPFDQKQLGRFNVTKKTEDKRVFKVPSLRNIQFTAPYFHDGAVWKLDEAVRIMADIQLGQQLSDGQVNDMVAFLQSLAGQRPKLEWPLLPASTQATPLPDPGYGLKKGPALGLK